MAETNVLIMFGMMYWYVWLALFVMALIPLMYFFDFWTSMKKYAEESVTEMLCSRPRVKKVLGRLIDGAGHEVSFPCSHSEGNPSLVDHENTMVSPNLISSAKMGRKPVGTPILNYVMPYILPVTFREAAALMQLKNYIRENHHEIDWMHDDVELMARVFATDNYLMEDCLTSANDNVRFEDINNLEEMDRKEFLANKAQELYSTIKLIREEMKITRLQAAPINLDEAAQWCNVGITNREIQEILTDQRRLDQMSVVNDFFGKYADKLMVMALSLAAVLITFLVLTQVK